MLGLDGWNCAIPLVYPTAWNRIVVVAFCWTLWHQFVIILYLSYLDTRLAVKEPQIIFNLDLRHREAASDSWDSE